MRVWFCVSILLFFYFISCDECIVTSSTGISHYSNTYIRICKLAGIVTPNFWSKGKSSISNNWIIYSYIWMHFAYVLCTNAFIFFRIFLYISSRIYALNIPISRLVCFLCSPRMLIFLWRYKQIVCRVCRFMGRWHGNELKISEIFRKLKQGVRSPFKISRGNWNFF